jgi:hypothetical protein
MNRFSSVHRFNNLAAGFSLLADGKKKGINCRRLGASHQPPVAGSALGNFLTQSAQSSQREQIF